MSQLSKPLPFEACENFRQLGGYQGAEGKHVREGIFYRAPALCNLHTAADVAAFEALGIRHVFDFRSSYERETQPDPAFAAIKQHNISALTAKDGAEINFDLRDIFAKGRQGFTEMLKSVHEGYATLPFGNAAYQELFHVLCLEEVPVLFHCTAGKDRTGVAAALILLALGVSREDVMADYLATNACRGAGVQQIASMLEPAGITGQEANDLAMLIGGVQAESLQLALDSIDEKYATFEAYLQAECGVDAAGLAAMRKAYLE